MIKLFESTDINAFGKFYCIVKRERTKFPKRNL